MQPTVPETRSSSPDTRIGIIIRVGFFVGITVIGLFFLSGLFLGLFGVVVAGTVGLCATGLFANVLTMRIFDRRPLTDIGLQSGRASVHNLFTGVILGGGLATCMLCAPLLAGTAHFAPRPNAAEFTWLAVPMYFLSLLVAACGEEMIFRGYAFQLLVEKLGPFATVLPAGVVFGLAHSANPNASRLGVLNTMLWGILLGFAFLRSHDLWLPIGLHFGWNAVLPLFGVNLSGLTIEVTRYFYRWDLAPVWSGGPYGPEGGLLASLFVVILFVILARAPVKPQRAAIAQILNATD